MAIEYLAGNRLRGLNSERTGITVANIIDGSIFHETDTNKSYILYNGSWSEL